MKATELIVVLAKLVEEFGDLPVQVRADPRVKVCAVVFTDNNDTERGFEIDVEVR